MDFYHYKINVHASTKDIYSAIDKASERLIRLVRKYKTKLQDHRGEHLADIDLKVNVLKPNELEDINDEMSDIYGIKRDFLYSFISCDVLLSLADCKVLFLKSGIDPKDSPKYIDILVWYGFLGIYVKDSEKYIYDLAYSMRKFKGLMAGENIFFKVNPAFHAALEVNI